VVPVLEDANAVQMALMQVMQLLATGRMDHKTAGLMLYALQTASINLRRTSFEAYDPTDVVIDRDTVRWTCLRGPQWVEEDFEDEEEEDDDEENAEEIAEGATEGAPEEEAPRSAASPESAEQSVSKEEPKKASGPASADAASQRKGVRPVRTIEEARTTVKAMARQFVLDTLGGETGRSPCPK
jgi:hypothetical protein